MGFPVAVSSGLFRKREWPISASTGIEVLPVFRATARPNSKLSVSSFPEAQPHNRINRPQVALGNKTGTKCIVVPSRVLELIGIHLHIGVRTQTQRLGPVRRGVSWSADDVSSKSFPLKSALPKKRDDYAKKPNSSPTDLYARKLSARREKPKPART